MFSLYPTLYHPTPLPRLLSRHRKACYLVMTQQMWRKRDPVEEPAGCRVIGTRDAAQENGHPSVADREHRHILTCTGLSFFPTSSSLQD